MKKMFITLTKLIFHIMLFCIYNKSISQELTSYNQNSIPIGGSSNVAFGKDVLNGTVGIGELFSRYNTAVGHKALTNGGWQFSNTAVGYSALYNSLGSPSGPSANLNTAIGRNSLYNNLTGSSNTGLGSYSDVSSGNLTNATAIGYGAIVNSSNSIQLGNSSVTTIYAGVGLNAKLITGNFQVIGGSPGLGKVLTSDAFGNATWQTTGGGGWSLTGNTGTIDGTNFIGTTDNVPFNIRVNNIASGRIDNDLQNAFYGTNAGINNISGRYNIALGSKSLYNNDIGIANVSIGTNAMYYNEGGNHNVAIGADALSFNRSGLYNTALGAGTMISNTVGYSNTVLGFDTDVALEDLSNSTALGAGSLVNASNKIRLGDMNVTVIEGNVAFSPVSDGRFKTNISEEDIKGLEFINRLRPVMYNLDTRKFQDFLTKNMPDSLRKIRLAKDFSTSTAIRRSGFIAQEVENAASEVGYDFDAINKPTNENDNYSLAYSQFVVPLVKSVQELSSQNEEIKKAMDEQKEINKLLRNEIEELRQMIRNNTGNTLDGDIKVTSTNTGAKLYQNTPNPFTKSTIIKYSIPEGTGKAFIIISTIDGKKISEHNLRISDTHQIEIATNKLSSGTYIYSLFINDILIDSKKMILVR